MKIYAIIDSEVIKRKNPEKMAERLFKSGATFVQLRNKNCSSYKLIGIAKKIQKIARRYRRNLLINDRVDVALASGAGGVHVGSGDMPVRTARLLLNKDMIIGKTIHTKKEAKRTQSENINYVSAGPVFSTPIKKHLKARGVNFIGTVKKYSSFPVFAIGGINSKNIKNVLKSGGDGVCLARAALKIEKLLHKKEK